MGWFRGASTPRRLADGGVLWNGLVLDITEQKHAEEQLFHTQKMEVLGQLTGGIAHDFNNLLAVVQGNAELLYEDLDSKSPHIVAIQRAAKSGAELTHRLLSYARRQPLRPNKINPGDLVIEISQMLAHSLGGTITLKTTTPSDIWHALADPGQVEHALLNLAINARDAMPNGGTLNIECTNVHLDRDAIRRLFKNESGDTIAEGDYVLLSVEDNGVGMLADTLEHAFDPFFTTKEIGQGSGLGLSMVYGFARQSGGGATIDSHQGDGTTVKIYLPRATTIDEEPAQSEMGPGPIGNGETILVVDDDEDVRSMIVDMLTSLGYKTVEASEVAAAETIIESGTHIDLVLSDVMLPGGATGIDLNATLHKNHPDLPILLISGYPMMGIVLPPNVTLLKKPFRKAELAQILCDVVK